jgi:hypothetical protein
MGYGALRGVDFTKGVQVDDFMKMVAMVQKSRQMVLNDTMKKVPTLHNDFSSITVVMHWHLVVRIIPK